MSMNCLELPFTPRKHYENSSLALVKVDYIRGGEYRSRTDDLLRARQAL